MDRILIALRIYPGAIKRPISGYPNNKIELVSLSIKQLRQSLKKYDYKIILINDGFNTDELNLILGETRSDILEIINTSGIGNFSTFELQIKKLLEYPEFNYLYFAEDDYLYLENFIEQNLQLLNTFDYTTGYYHPDYENLNLHKSFSSKENCPQISTTCSFWTKRNILLKDANRLRMYSKLGDLGFWLLLTCSFRQILYRFFICLRSPNELKLCSRILRTLFVKGSKFFYSDTRKLVASYPSTSTHVDKKYLAVGWLH
tara:strand:+ start:246 stop:1022 length:777 start_codon:yes stop_codon:yes gene_type:complete